MSIPKALSIGLLILLASTGAPFAQGPQPVRCVAADKAVLLPPNTHLLQPAAGLLLARLGVGLPTSPTDIFVVEGPNQAAIFFIEGGKLCGGILVERGPTQQGLLSVVHRFGA